MDEPRWDLGAVVVFQSYHDTWSSAADPSYHLFWDNGAMGGRCALVGAISHLSR